MYSCSSNSINQEKIIGKWKITEYNADMKDISPMVIEEGRKIALTTSYDFKKDNSYTYSSDFETAKGTWKIIKDSIIMNYSSNYDKNAEESYKIIQLTESRMVWFIEFDYGTSETILTKD